MRIVFISILCKRDIPILIVFCICMICRVNGVLAVSRAFGDTRFKNTNSWREGHAHVAEGPVIAVPDIYSEVCTPHTEFCIIATDGLWDVMNPQLAVNFVRTKLSKKYDLQECAKELVMDAVRNRGSVDNVTVVLLSFHMNSDSSPSK
jgi:protein phosphatase 2C family protein 2/3